MNPEYLNLLKTLQTSNQPDILKFFMINMGPHVSLEEGKPFLKKFEKRIDGANFYPTDMTKEEFEKWVQTLSTEDQKVIFLLFEFFIF